jgi:hypothetical protein
MEAKPFLRQGRDTIGRVTGLVRYYRESVCGRHPSTVVDGLASLFEHERVHFSKMIASLLDEHHVFLGVGLVAECAFICDGLDQKPHILLCLCGESGRSLGPRVRPSQGSS